MISFLAGLAPILGQLFQLRSLIEIAALSAVLISSMKKFSISYFFIAYYLLILSAYSIQGLNDIVLLMWGMAVAGYFSNPENFRINLKKFYFGMMLSITFSAFYLVIHPLPDLQGRFAGLFSSVLAYGFVASSLMVLTLCLEISQLRKFFLLTLILLLAIPSGSRHPVLISLLCYIHLFFEMSLPKKILVALIVLISIGAGSEFIDLSEFRSFSPNEVSDGTRFNVIKKYIESLDFISFLFGHGRNSNGSLAYALGYLNDITIESSYLTFAYSYGFLLFTCIFFIFLSRVVEARNKKKLKTGLFFIHLLSGFVSQVFENPVMLMIYVFVFSAILNLDVLTSNRVGLYSGYLAAANKLNFRGKL